MLKVLVADDHQLYREGLSQLVSQLDDDVESVQAGHYTEVLDILRTQGPFDLVLMDLKMPMSNRCEGVKMVKQAAGSCPVVIVSAFETRQNIEEAIASGASGFLPKSSQISVMLGALKLVLLGETYVPTAIYRESEAADPAPSSGGRPAPRQTEAVRARLGLLTQRQLDVLALVGEGRSNKDIAEVLGISEGTVKVHVGAILKALGATNRTQAALIAIDFDIAPDDAASRLREA